MSTSQQFRVAAERRWANSKNKPASERMTPYMAALGDRSLGYYQSYIEANESLRHIALEFGLVSQAAELPIYAGMYVDGTRRYYTVYRWKARSHWWVIVSSSIMPTTTRRDARHLVWEEPVEENRGLGD